MHNKRGIISSPLRQLGLHSSRTKGKKDHKNKNNQIIEEAVLTKEDGLIDRQSIYSFESVNTTDRLLDRLDIESTNFEKGEGDSRNSVVWIDSKSPIVEEDSSFEVLSRCQRELSHSFDKRSPDINEINVKQLPLDIILKDSKSVESFKVDIKRASMNSYVADYQSVLSTPSIIEEYLENEVSNESTDQGLNDSIFRDDNSLSNSSISIQSHKSQPPNGNLTQASNNENIIENTPSYSISNTTGNNTNELTPDSRIKLASQLRKESRHREASYQLQIAANIPNNHPKAMFLYAMALRYGQGVKQNDLQSIRWLCKCILVGTNTNSTSLIEKLNRLEPDALISLCIDTLNLPINIYDILDNYSNLPKVELSKIVNQFKKQPSTSSLAYHELGIALINGWGTPKNFELSGMDLLSKAASMGNTNSMMKLGDLWCTKTKTHKKDLVKASAWLRLAELFDVKAIGNSWIYKDKYILRSKK